jgi:hypothetical protein
MYKNRKMPTITSIIGKPCNPMSRIEAKERVVEIARANYLENQQLIFKIKKPSVFAFMDNNTDNKFEDNTINNKVPL